MQKAPIGLFDSGVGGISVANAVRRALPAENLIYVADSGYAPYGNKTPEQIHQRARHIVEFLQNQGVKLIVVACNTATLSCIQQLRNEYNMPFVGVEPGIKPALMASKTGRVGVLATQLTIQSKQYHDLIQRVAANRDVYSQACNGLADQIELGEFDSPTTRSLLQTYVQPLLDAGVDQIALGCTHYGFVSDVLEQLIAGRASLVDTDDAIARQTKAILDRYSLLNPSTDTGTVCIYSSDLSKTSTKTIHALWQAGVAQVSQLPSI